MFKHLKNSIGDKPDLPQEPQMPEFFFTFLYWLAEMLINQHTLALGYKFLKNYYQSKCNWDWNHNEILNLQIYLKQKYVT